MYRKDEIESDNADLALKRVNSALVDDPELLAQADEATLELIRKFKPVSQADLKLLLKQYKKRIARLQRLKDRAKAQAKTEVRKKKRRKMAKESRTKNRR